MTSETLPERGALFPLSCSYRRRVRCYALPVLMQILLFTGVFAVGLSGAWSWQFLTVLYYFLPLFLLPGALFFPRLFDFGVLTILFIAGMNYFGAGWVALIFFCLLGACRSCRDSFFLRLFFRRFDGRQAFLWSLQVLCSGFLSLVFFNLFLPVQFADNINLIAGAALGCSFVYSFGIYFNLFSLLRSKRNKQLLKTRLEPSYQEIMQRFMDLSNRIISYAGEQNDKELLSFMENMQNTGVELIFRGNELFSFLRDARKEGYSGKEPELIANDSEDFLLQERTEILRQKNLLLEELEKEEKKLWDSLENMILRMENLSLSLIGKKGAFLFDSDREIGILNRKMEDVLVLLDEKRKAIKLLSET